MKRIMLAALAAAATLAYSPAAASAISCQVSTPISAAELNSVNPPWPWTQGDPGTWYFEVTGGTADGHYLVKVQWAGDPSNGGHPSWSIVLDATGYGIEALPRWWAPDGTLPGHSVGGGGGIENFVADPGVFSVQVYPDGNYTPRAQGKANCSGAVGA